MSYNRHSREAASIRSAQALSESIAKRLIATGCCFGTLNTLKREISAELSDIDMQPARVRKYMISKIGLLGEKAATKMCQEVLSIL